MEEYRHVTEAMPLGNYLAQRFVQGCVKSFDVPVEVTGLQRPAQFTLDSTQRIIRKGRQVVVPGHMNSAELGRAAEAEAEVFFPRKSLVRFLINTWTGERDERLPLVNFNYEAFSRSDIQEQ